MAVKIIGKGQQIEKSIKEYGRLIFTICYSMTHDYFAAEDLMQETFLSAYKNYHKFDGKNLKGWLTTIAANKTRDYLKSSYRKIIIVADNELQKEVCNRELPEEILLNKEVENRLFGVCDKLKEPYRSISILHFCKNMSIKEIELLTGKNLKTLQTQIYRAKEMLKQKWKEEFCE